MSISSTNPVDGKILKTFTAYTAAEIETRLEKAHQAYMHHLSDLSTEQKKRVLVLSKAAELLEARKQELGKIMTLEMGKTLKSAIQEIEKCAANCRYYAENGLNAIKPETIDLGDAKRKAELRYLPIGVVLAIMPWNFPFWQVFRGAAPILLAGNSFVLKHASNVPQSALAIEQIFIDAGLTHGAFQTLLVGSEVIGKLIDDPRIQGVTLTGSEGAGRDVASRAGKAIKKSVMELGGSDPFIVMPSAKVDLAAETAANARLICNGQSCIAAKRFIVHESIYEGFKAKFIEVMKTKRLGDPMSETVDIGPLVSVKARDEIHELVLDAVKNGATLSLGGVIPKSDGAYYPATVLEKVTEKAKIRQEEAFGPVAVLYSVKDLSEAIELANSTRFGLGSSFWSNDAKEIEQATLEIQSGAVFVNELVASDPRLAFGGVKASGYGRELGTIGMHEFTNLKTVVIKA